MNVKNNSILPSKPQNYLINDKLHIVAKAVNLGVVGHTADWRELTESEKTLLLTEWEKGDIK